MIEPMIEPMKITRDTQVDKWIDEIIAQNRIILETNIEFLKRLAHPPMIYWTEDNKP